ncbi:MAG: cytochrome c peroxidase [Thermodesulfovibrionia bacterium]
MKAFRILLLSLMVNLFVISLVFAGGDAVKGKSLFNNPKFASGSRSCNSCHPDGKGLENAADKKEFRIMGKSQKGLEEAVNFCIVNANKGKAIDVNSPEMQDIVAYIKSLKKKPTMPGY